MASIHVSAGIFNRDKDKDKAVEFVATDKKVLGLGKHYVKDKNKIQPNDDRKLESVNNQIKNNAQIPPRNIEETDKEPIGGDDMII